MVQQFIHGTQYIDELVMVRAKDKGDLYVHQDANWSVIGATDLGRHVVERSVYTPYGELTVHQDTGFGDRDGDQDVDSTDKGTVGTTCTGTVTGSCRILDLDFDGDYDSTDATKFDALTQGAMRHPGRPATNVSQPFAHQGLLFEPELAQYQNRARQYDPGKRRFAQRDPLSLAANPLRVLRLLDPRGTLYCFPSSNPLSGLDPFGLFNVGACIAYCGGRLAGCLAAITAPNCTNVGKCTVKYKACETSCGNADVDSQQGDDKGPPPYGPGFPYDPWPP